MSGNDEEADKQPGADRVRNALRAVAGWLFGGRIARTTFAIRVIVFALTIFIIGVPLNTILATSSKTLNDIYGALFLGMLAVCLIGFISVYVKRLHDIGLRGYWAFVALIGIPAIIIWLGGVYTDYRYENEGLSANLSGFDNVLIPIALILPVLLALWKGQAGENRFGPPPEAVEHFTASKFNVAAAIGAAAILIPTSIYVGLFQSGVWVGRGRLPPPMPMIDSNSSGRLLAKCWNIRGVGAGTGEGALSGIYRDGYGGSVLDFVVSESGEIDIIPAGETFAKAYRSDGFRITSYGLDTSVPYVTAQELDRFMIVAVFEGDGILSTNVNYTSFSFAKTDESGLRWQVIMTTGMSLGASGLLNDEEQARGRLMIGDCIVR